MSDVIRTGYEHLVINRTSRSGYGESGGFTGDKGVPNSYLSRWNPEAHVGQVRSFYEAMSVVNLRDGRVHCRDYREVLRDETVKRFLVLDPPYYVAGKGIYKFAFSHDDHVQLARILSASSHDWVLCYDDHPFIWALYDGCASIAYDYPRRGKRRRELLVTPLALSGHMGGFMSQKASDRGPGSVRMSTSSTTPMVLGRAPSNGWMATATNNVGGAIERLKLGAARGISECVDVESCRPVFRNVNRAADGCLGAAVATEIGRSWPGVRI